MPAAAVAAWAVPAATSLISGWLGKKGAKKQAKADALALQYAEMARARARQHLSEGGIFNASHGLFPGLMKNPTTGAYHAKMPWGSKTLPTGGAQPFGPTGRLSDTVASGNPMPWSMMPKRAYGGPVNAGQPTVVGEQGPEVMVPSQPGQIMPNPGTQPPPGAPVPPGGGGGGGSSPSATPPPPPPGGTFTPGLRPGGQTFSAGATSATPQNPLQGMGPGELATARTWDYLANPGQISTTAYERAQENANTQLNTQLSGVMGGLTGRGIDYGRGGLGGIMVQNAVLNSGKLRNEASRDLSQMQEALRREDINQGVNNYLQFLQTVFGLQGARANAELGASFPSAGTNANPYAGMASGISTAGYLLGKYFDQQKTQQQPATGQG